MRGGSGFGGRLASDFPEIIQHVPPVFLGVILGEAGHRFAALGNFPEEIAIGVRDTVRIVQVAGLDLEILHAGAVTSAGVAVAGGALLGPELTATGERGIGRGDGIFLFGGTRGRCPRFAFVVGRVREQRSGSKCAGEDQQALTVEFPGVLFG